MGPAVQLGVGRMRRTQRPRGGVVDIATLSRGITPRKPTGQIPPADELRQCRGGSIPRLCIHRLLGRLAGCGRHPDRFDFGVGSHVTHRFGRQDPMPGQIARRIRATVDRGLSSQYMHHGRISGGPVLRGRAVLAPAPAGQVGLQSGQRPDRVGAALLMAAWILLTHCVGHRIQALIQRRRLDSINIGPNRGHARCARFDLHEPLLTDIRRHPHPVGVQFGDPLIDPIPQLPLGEPHPTVSSGGQLGIQPGPHRRIDDAGAGDDHPHHPIVDVPDREAGRHQGQLVA
nr:hypothetical protein CPGR_00659 [Mycolicibacterium fortuitum subsp. fortuitum DSM 46621 = ATCC 6841 = JCM 6387]